MITISDMPLDTLTIRNEYSNNSIPSFILTTLNQVNDRVNYQSIDELKFELQLRSAMVDSAIELSQCNLGFSTFQQSKCNNRYWIRLRNGGFQVLSNVKPSIAIMDIYHNGHLYATECATATVIVLYRALLMVFQDNVFNQNFSNMHLTNWHNLDPKIADIGHLKPTTYYLPGDRRYFSNPDVAPHKLIWQGENSIQLVDDKHYAHEYGIVSADEIISLLNNERRRNATRSAYLKKEVGRPDFNNLFKLMGTSINSNSEKFNLAIPTFMRLGE